MRASCHAAHAVFDCLLLACRRHCHVCQKGMLASMQWQQQAPLVRHFVVATATANQISYEWSWRNIKGQLPEEPSDFDIAHQLPVQVSGQVRPVGS